MKNLTQKLCLTLTLALLLFTSTCFAKITTDDLCIGGISFGQPISEVIAKYGEPEKKPDGWGGFYNSFSGIRGEIRVSEGDTVTWVRVAGDSRYATKKGIRIGSTSDEVEAAYGTAERHVFTRDENNNPIHINALRYPTFVLETISTGTFKRGIELMFVLDKNKKVTDIYFMYAGE